MAIDDEPHHDLMHLSGVCVCVCGVKRDERVRLDFISCIIHHSSSKTRKITISHLTSMYSVGNAEKDILAISETQYGRSKGRKGARGMFRVLYLDMSSHSIQVHSR